MSESNDKSTQNNVQSDPMDTLAAAMLPPKSAIKRSRILASLFGNAISGHLVGPLKSISIGVTATNPSLLTAAFTRKALSRLTSSDGTPDEPASCIHNILTGGDSESGFHEHLLLTKDEQCLFCAMADSDNAAYAVPFDSLDNAIRSRMEVRGQHGDDSCDHSQLDDKSDPENRNAVHSYSVGDINGIKPDKIAAAPLPSDFSDLGDDPEYLDPPALDEYREEYEDEDEEYEDCEYEDDFTGSLLSPSAADGVSSTALPEYMDAFKLTSGLAHAIALPMAICTLLRERGSRIHALSKPVMVPPPCTGIVFLLRVKGQYVIIGMNATLKQLQAIGVQYIDIKTFTPTENVNISTDIRHGLASAAIMLANGLASTIAQLLPDSADCSSVYHAMIHNDLGASTMASFIKIALSIVSASPKDAFETTTAVMEAMHANEADEPINLLIDFCSSAVTINDVADDFALIHTILGVKFYRTLANQHYMKAPFIVNDLKQSARFMLAATSYSSHDVRMIARDAAVEFSVTVEPTKSGGRRSTMYVSAIGMYDGTSVSAIVAILRRAYIINNARFIHFILPDADDPETCDIINAMNDRLEDHCINYIRLMESISKNFKHCRITERRTRDGGIGKMDLDPLMPERLNVIKYMIAFT